MTKKEIDMIVKHDIENARLVKLVYRNGVLIKEKVYKNNSIIIRSFK